MRISDWSSDVCSSDLLPGRFSLAEADEQQGGEQRRRVRERAQHLNVAMLRAVVPHEEGGDDPTEAESEDRQPLHALQQHRRLPEQVTSKHQLPYGADIGRTQVSTPLNYTHRVCRHSLK